METEDRVVERYGRILLHPCSARSGRFRLQVLVMHGSDVSGDEWWLVRAYICHVDRSGGLNVWGTSPYKEQGSQELALPGSLGLPPAEAPTQATF